MDEITKRKQELRLRTWEKMYDEFQSSKMTIKDWCNEQNLSVKTFYYRLRRIRENALKTTEKHDIVPVFSANEDLKPEHEKTQEKIRITGNGITVDMPVSISTEFIIAILNGVR